VRGGAVSHPAEPDQSVSDQTSTPMTALKSMSCRRFLLSAWPWRTLRYVLGTAVPMLLALPLVAFVVPVVVAVVELLHRRETSLLAVMPEALISAVLIAALGPLAAIPLAGLERRRLRLIDPRPVVSLHQQPGVRGLRAWLRTRYTEAATWREVGYGYLLMTVILVLYALTIYVLLVIGVGIASSVLLRVADGSISLGFVVLTSAGQALPYTLAGIVLLPTIPYLLALLAGIHGALVRALVTQKQDERWRTELVEVTRSRARLVDAFEAERRRIERDLHDGAQQQLVSLTLRLGLARMSLDPGSPADNAVADAHSQAKQLMVQLRELIRGIHPRTLIELGLAAALKELVDQSAVPVTLHCPLSGRLTGQVESTVYFVVAEALANIGKHSDATQATVTVRRTSKTLRVEIGDNGSGGADPNAGTGLTGLADRVAAIDGRMWLSSPVGGPTQLHVELPCRPIGPSE
jgi:signal transduction histidine kinase